MEINKKLFAEKCVELNSEYLAYQEMTGSKYFKEITIEAFNLINDPEVDEYIREIRDKQPIDWFKEDSVNAYKDIIANGKTPKDRMEAVKGMNSMLNFNLDDDDSDIAGEIEEELGIGKEKKEENREKGTTTNEVVEKELL